jgi:uncharacterized caspase-like protein
MRSACGCPDRLPYAVIRVTEGFRWLSYSSRPETRGGLNMRLWIVALLMLGIAGTANAAKAERRVALVMGNGAYQNMPQLQCPADDAGAMAELLRKVGFDVIEGRDLDGKQMKKRLLEFGKQADGADLALLYFSGQSFTVNGTNYLLPVDARIKPADLATPPGRDIKAKPGELISLNGTIDETMSHARIKLVFFDASRMFPVGKIGASSGAGLAELKTQEGTMIEFATGPGQTALDGAKGAHSPFTRALLANIAAPGMEIQQAMTRVRAQVNEETSRQQLPWRHTYLIGDVYLNPAAAAPSPEKETK